MTYTELWQRLVPLYGQREAVAIVRALLDDLFGLSLTDIVGGKVSELSAEEQQLVEEKMQRLVSGEPLQYVVGHAWFCGRRFDVNPSVLIPRPETEVLCKRIAEDYGQPYCALQPPEPLRILDIGTGSGCIAVTLALDLRNSDVDAWDISGDALLTARQNAHMLQARVNFSLHDALDTEALPVPDDDSKYSIIVSNPPYICDSESKDMRQNVLGFEPHGALFVPDDRHLLFYSPIADYAAVALKPGGRLYFEINPLYADDITVMLLRKGFTMATAFNDQFGKRRFIVASSRADNLQSNH